MEKRDPDNAFLVMLEHTVAVRAKGIEDPLP
jgi:hypothetical protein